MQLYKMELKIASGAQFLITQLGFNVRKLYELRQYMMREGLGHIPVLANVYVPTATIARMMRSGELAGCVVADALIQRLESEKKPQRLERAALMVAAAKDLGFAGAHIGGFGLTHKDFLTILDRARTIGADWRRWSCRSQNRPANSLCVRPKPPMCAPAKPRSAAATMSAARSRPLRLLGRQPLDERVRHRAPGLAQAHHARDGGRGTYTLASKGMCPSLAHHVLAQLLAHVETQLRDRNCAPIDVSSRACKAQ